MNSVHARCDHDHVQGPFDSNREAPVGMMKKGCCFKGDEENEQHRWRDTEEHDSERKKSGREDHFAKMKSRGRAHVHVEIGMVHVVEAPEEWEHVICVMPPPIGVIHEQECGDDVRPHWQREIIQQTNMTMLRPHRERQRNWQHREPNECEAGEGKNKVAHETAQRAKVLSTQREAPLQQ